MTSNGEEGGDQASDATAGVLESPVRPREHSAPCVISPVHPGIPEPGPVRDGGPGVSKQLSTNLKQDQGARRVSWFV